MAIIERHPGERPLVGAVPLLDHRCLPVSGGGDDEHGRGVAVREQARRESLTRNQPTLLPGTLAGADGSSRGRPVRVLLRPLSPRLRHLVSYLVSPIRRQISAMTCLS